MRRGIRVALATGAALLALAPLAQADHHEVMIAEVFPGESASPAAEFVEIQMFLANQELLNQTDLVFYNGSSVATGTLELEDVASGQNQRTLLAGTPEFEALFQPKQADVEYASAMNPAGGALCLVSESAFGTLDCVAWGTASVAGAGTPAVALPNGSTLVRDISAGCNTLLERSDDTDSSLDDFIPTGVPTPQENSDVGPNSTCPNTLITKAPKAKTTDRTPKFEFSGGPDYDCNLDGQGFDDCARTYEPGRLSRGKHSLKVRAREGDGSVDGTPAKYSWKIVRN